MRGMRKRGEDWFRRSVKGVRVNGQTVTKGGYAEMYRSMWSRLQKGQSTTRVGQAIGVVLRYCKWSGLQNARLEMFNVVKYLIRPIV